MSSRRTAAESVQIRPRMSTPTAAALLTALLRRARRRARLPVSLSSPPHRWCSSRPAGRGSPRAPVEGCSATSTSRRPLHRHGVHEGDRGERAAERADAELIARLGGSRAPVLVALTVVIMFPGMITILHASVLGTGVIVAPVLIGWDCRARRPAPWAPARRSTDDRPAGERPVMIIGGGIDMPYVGVGRARRFTISPQSHHALAGSGGISGQAGRGRPPGAGHLRASPSAAAAGCCSTCRLVTSFVLMSAQELPAVVPGSTLPLDVSRRSVLAPSRAARAALRPPARARQVLPRSWHPRWCRHADRDADAHGPAWSHRRGVVAIPACSCSRAFVILPLCEAFRSTEARACWACRFRPRAPRTHQSSCCPRCPLIAHGQYIPGGLHGRWSRPACSLSRTCHRAPVLGRRGGGHPRTIILIYANPIARFFGV